MSFRTDRWTPEQAWAIYQLLEQIREELLNNHKENIQYYQHRERRLDAYVEQVERMSEEERIDEGIWLEAREPDGGSF